MIEVKKGPQRTEWLESPYTEHVAKTARENRREALERLIGACMGSLDPTVVRYYERYLAAKSLHELVTVKEAGKEHEDDEFR